MSRRVRRNVRGSRRLPSANRASRRRSPAETVRQGWNRVSWVYRPDTASFDGTGHQRREYSAWLSPLLKNLPRGSQVLDLGCGNGDPTALRLARKFRVTGVDISEVQVRRARSLVPTARFVRADMTELRFPPESFDAVVALYSIIHVPLRKQRPLFRRIHRWLTPGGWLLAILGKTAWTGTEPTWLGVEAEMYWSHTDAQTYVKWLQAIGFRTVQQQYTPEGASGHELFLVRKIPPPSSWTPRVR